MLTSQREHHGHGNIVNGNIVFKFVKHVCPSIMVFQLGTRNYISIAVLTAIDGFFVVFNHNWWIFCGFNHKWCIFWNFNCNWLMDYKTYINSSQHRPLMMHYQYIVPNPFYKLKYDVTVYEQFFYDVLVATMFPFTICSYTNFPASTLKTCLSTSNTFMQDCFVLDTFYFHHPSLGSLVPFENLIICFQNK